MLKPVTRCIIWVIKMLMAERQGFEPWVGLPPQRFSRPPRSTTPAPLRIIGRSCQRSGNYARYRLSASPKYTTCQVLASYDPGVCHGRKIPPWHGLIKRIYPDQVTHRKQTCFRYRHHSHHSTFCQPRPGAGKTHRHWPLAGQTAHQAQPRLC